MGIIDEIQKSLAENPSEARNRHHSLSERLGFHTGSGGSSSSGDSVPGFLDSHADDDGRGQAPFSYKRLLAAQEAPKARLIVVPKRLHRGRTPAQRMEVKVQEALYSRFQHVDADVEEMTYEQQATFYAELVEEVIQDVLHRDRTKLPKEILSEVKRNLMDGIMGFGPIQRLLDQPGVSEVMVNGVDKIYIEKHGKLSRTDVVFRDVGQLRQVVDKITIPIGRRCDDMTPYCDARLPDGSRVNIIIPPLALNGPTITIRRFSKTPFSMESLVGFGTLTAQMAAFIRASVLSRQNILVSGGTGSGKTTTLNAISSYIPSADRIITIEDSAELQLVQPHVVRLETRQANTEGKGEISIQELFKNTLRMIPKRIVVGECRGAEAMDMIAAMSSGTPGSLSTLHANTPQDCLSRLETMIMMAGMNLSSRGIRELISSAVNVIVQQERLSDGKRRITYISEVTGMVDGEVQCEDIFRWIQTGVDARGQTLGVLKSTGYIPKVLDKFFEWGIDLPRDLLDEISPMDVLHEDWKRRRKEESARDEARIKAKVALQMAMEERSSLEDMSRLQVYGGVEGQSQIFNWQDALVSHHEAPSVGASTAGGSWSGTVQTAASLATAHARGTANSTVLKTRGGGVLHARLRPGALESVTETLTEKQIKGLSALFNDEVLGTVPERLRALRGDRPFQDVEEEARFLRGLVEESLRDFAPGLRFQLGGSHRERLIKDALANMVGLGPIQQFIESDGITEIMVNGPNQIYYEQGGKLILSSVKFRDNAHVIHVLQKIIAPLGRRCDESSPMVDARTQQGYRLNAIIPPLALTGPTLTIRKFADNPLTIETLIDKGTLSRRMADFLEACIKLRLNVFVSGGTGSGKTTTLNAISRMIPECRIVTIEDAAELRLQQDHVVRLETRPPNVEGRGAISIRELLKNALHMSPDRIIVGECRGGEALDMIAAMSAGNKGSLSTGHANTPEDLIRRLETMVLMSGVELPIRAIAEQIGSAVDVVIQQDRFQDGTRKITHIAEVVGCIAGEVKVQDIFFFQQKGIDPVSGKVMGEMVFSGVVPTFLIRFLDEGIPLAEDLFGEEISIKQLLSELDQKRREADIEELQINLKKSRALEESVLFGSEVYDWSENPLQLLEVETDRTQADKDLKTLGARGAKTHGGASAEDSFTWRRCLKEHDRIRKESAVERKKTSRDASKEIIRAELEKTDFSRVLIANESKFTSLDDERLSFVDYLMSEIDQILQQKRAHLKRSDCREIAIDMADDFLRLGPIQKLMDEDAVSEIMVNGADKIFIERKGKIVLSEVTFKNSDHAMRILNRILAPIGRRCDMNSPLVDARTPDGFRVNAVIPPVSGTGIVITIRKFSRTPISIAMMVAKATLSPKMAEFISGAVHLRRNIVVSGGTGSGKTTSLNAISAFIPEGERILTIEDTAELQLQQEHVVALETRPANQEGAGEVPMRLLVRNVLRMRPDRIIIGECRGGEALDMLQAMNTGNEGSMTTGHASTPKDMMTRFETMVMMAKSNLSSKSVREQIASAIDLVVQVARFRDGTRKITHISEVKGMRDDQVQVEDIFVFEQRGYDAEGRVKGEFKATGYVPSFMLKFQREDIRLPEDLFGEERPLSQIYERLNREQNARESRESNRERLRVKMEASLDGEREAGGPDGEPSAGDRESPRSGFLSLDTNS